MWRYLNLDGIINDAIKDFEERYGNMPGNCIDEDYITEWFMIFKDSSEFAKEMRKIELSVNDDEIANLVDKVISVLYEIVYNTVSRHCTDKN